MVENKKWHGLKVEQQAQFVRDLTEQLHLGKTTNNAFDVEYKFLRGMHSLSANDAKFRENINDSIRQIQSGEGAPF